jgi:hypothetical protein
VKLPLCAGALTTVSFFSPQAHIVAGVAEDTTSAAHATTTASSQNIRNFLRNFTPLFSSRDNSQCAYHFINLHPRAPGCQQYYESRLDNNLLNLYSNAIILVGRHIKYVKGRKEISDGTQEIF